MPDGGTGAAPSQLLRRRGLRARKSLGQNFLRDRSYLTDIVEAADVRADDEILEIGAGTGVLTTALAERARRVVAVELDEALIELLRDELSQFPHVELVHLDALKLDPCEIFSGPYKLLGNIPYYITGPILRHFLETPCRPEVLVLMVQREVAERMAAKPGEMSLLATSVQYYARVEIVTRVPAGAFTPRPKVDSAIVRLTPGVARQDSDLTNAFFEVARAGFATRRKQLANSLSRALVIPRPVADDILRQAGIDGARRAETLSVEEWNRLAAVWRETAPEGGR